MKKNVSVRTDKDLSEVQRSSDSLTEAKTYVDVRSCRSLTDLKHLASIGRHAVLHVLLHQGHILPVCS